jgi:hypothetical protein
VAQASDVGGIERIKADICHLRRSVEIWPKADARVFENGVPLLRSTTLTKQLCPIGFENPDWRS